MSFLVNDFYHFKNNKADVISGITTSKKMKQIKRMAKASWHGTLKEGNGSLTTTSGMLTNTNYSYKTRFEEGERGTNPEELLAAAHAGCFTMWVSSELTMKRFKPKFLDTMATVTMEDSVIIGTHLAITGSVDGITDEEFEAITKDSAKNCIISKATLIQSLKTTILSVIPDEMKHRKHMNVLEI